MLAQRLGVTPGQIESRVARTSSFVYLKHQLPDATADAIEALHVEGIHESPEFRRYYPEGDIAAPLIGFTGIDGAGEDGLELSEEKLLGAVDGSKLVIQDRFGHLVRDLGYVEVPRWGTTVQITIDSKIQYSAYSALRQTVDETHAESGSAIVVDGRTGEILALANYPSFDPNDRATMTGSRIRNVAVTDVFEPGSIMKPFTVALALDLHRVTPTSLVETNRQLVLDGARITDDANFGTLTVAGVIQKSSNIGATKIALTMQPRQMWEMFHALGFGQQPKLVFPGAGTGILRPWQRWRRVEQATMSYGYGISASLLQLAQAYTVFSDDGCMLPLTLLKGSTPSVDKACVFSPQTADAIRQMLETVTRKGGTAPLVQLSGYSAGGKTGTAYTATPHGYNHSEYRASFVGIVPIRNPRLVVAVSINRPQGARHFGGDVSGPPFARIAQQAMQELNIEPDEGIEAKPGAWADKPNS